MYRMLSNGASLFWNNHSNLRVRSIHSILPNLNHSFSEELPSRCKKEIIRAADYHDDGKITIDGLYQIVSNIGAADDVSKADIGGIFDELGDHSSTENTIEVKDMLKLIWPLVLTLLDLPPNGIVN